MNTETIALLRDLGAITPKVKKLAMQRLGFTDEKIALLLVKAINPHEVLTEEEEATLRGITAKTLRGFKQDKMLPQKM